MIKLITQFDAPNARPSHATPTCCCCCCSCIVTMVTTGMITNRNVRQSISADLPPNPSAEEISKARSKKLWLGTLAALLIPLALILSGLFIYLQDSSGYFGSEVVLFYFSAPVLIYIFGMVFLHNTSGMTNKKTITITIVTLVTMVVEFFGWLFLLLHSSIF
jgi:cation transport ATPase